MSATPTSEHTVTGDQGLTAAEVQDRVARGLARLAAVADAHRGAVPHKDNGVALDMPGHPPRKRQVGQLLGTGLALAHDLPAGGVHVLLAAVDLLAAWLGGIK